MQTVLPFTARCYSPRYLPIAANEPEVSPIGLLPRLRKWWIYNTYKMSFTGRLRAGLSLSGSSK